MRATEHKPIGGIKLGACYAPELRQRNGPAEPVQLPGDWSQVVHTDPSEKKKPAGLHPGGLKTQFPPKEERPDEYILRKPYRRCNLP